MGIQSYASHDSGAALIKLDTNNFKIDYVCISEERLNRIKHPYSFPYYSIQYCLDYFKLKDLSKINYLISDWKKEKKWIRSGPSYNYSMFDYLKEKFKFNNKILQIDHHLAHAASVFYTSNFKKSSFVFLFDQVFK